MYKFDAEGKLIPPKPKQVPYWAEGSPSFFPLSKDDGKLSPDSPEYLALARLKAEKSKGQSKGRGKSGRPRLSEAQQIKRVHDGLYEQNAARRKLIEDRKELLRIVPIVNKEIWLCRFCKATAPLTDVVLKHSIDCKVIPIYLAAKLYRQYFVLDGKPTEWISFYQSGNPKRFIPLFSSLPLERKAKRGKD